MEPHPVGPRIAAYVIDVVVSWLVALPFMGCGLAMIPMMNRSEAMTPFLILTPIGNLFGFVYLFLRDTPKKGSIGKRIMRLRCVKLDGSPCGFVGSIARNFLLCIALVELIVFFVRPDRRRLGDLIAGTRVEVTPAPAAPVAH